MTIFLVFDKTLRGSTLHRLVLLFLTSATFLLLLLDLVVLLFEGGRWALIHLQNFFIRIKVIWGCVKFLNLAYLADDLKDILLVQLLLGPEAPTELVNDIVSVWRVDLRQTKTVSA